MAQVVLNVDEDVATWSSGIAAGAGLHLPVGAYGSANYRSAIRFNPPAGWQDWTAITKATLSFYISDFDHVGPRNSSIYVRRQNVSAPLWTKAAGSQNCESGFAAGNTTQYDDIAPTSTDQVTFASGTTANAKKTVTVTGMLVYYHAQNASKLVFVFDEVGSGDYTELWSESKSGGYDATLTIDYEVQSVPDAPTLVAPANGATVVTQNPTFDWTHNDPQGDPQTAAQVRVWDAAGTTQVGPTVTVPSSASAVVWPAALARGTTYQWDVHTSDATGYGTYSAKRTVSIKANPVVTIDATRYMEMYNGVPRLRVKWSLTGGTQKRYRVTGPGGYDTGLVTSTAQSVRLNGLALTNGIAASITVEVTTTDDLTDDHTRSFTPRWGLTVHRRDLTAAPVNWGSPVIQSTVPTGASLTIEYGSAATAVPAPSTWYASLSSVPKARYVFWRAWLLPSATEGPSLNKLTIPADFAAAAVDHWFDNPTSGPLAAPWSIDSGEYVYGTRSLTRPGDGVVDYAYSERIKVRAGRSYILTGLMKSEGNSGALFNLYDPDEGLVVKSPTGANIQSDILTATRDWFEPDRLDVYRYKTPVYVAPNDMEVMVRCRVAGAAGTQGWFDGLKLEESTVATPWGPAAVGAVSVDAGGVQVDATKGGIFRLRAANGSVVEQSPTGLQTNGDLAISAPGALSVPITGSAVPTINNGGTATFSNVSSEWVKIGRQVTFKVAFTVTAAGSGATAITLTGTGLPSPGTFIRIFGDRGSSGVDAVVGRLSTAGTINPLSPVTAPGTGITGAGLTLNTVIVLSGSYLAAA